MDEAIGNDRRARCALIGIVLVSSFWALGLRELWNPVEPRYAGIIATLVDGHDWLVPQYQDTDYDQKPPLAFWLSAGLHRVFGVERSLFLTRLPSALGLLALVLLTFELGRRFFGSRSAFISAAILATSWLPVWSSRFAHLDTLYSAALVGTFLAIEVVGSRSKRARRGPVFWGGLCLGIAFLIKGPGLLAFVVLIQTLRALFERNRRPLLNRGLFAMTLIATIIALAWLIPAAAQAKEGWLTELAVEQGLLRLSSDLPPKKHGPFYYLEVCAPLLAPWAITLPFLFLALLRGQFRIESQRTKRGLTFAAIWIAVVFLVLSFGVTKRSRYLMMGLPSVALMLGPILARHDDVMARVARGLLVVVSVAVASFLVFMAWDAETLSSMIGGKRIPEYGIAIASRGGAWPYALLGALSCVAAVISWCRKRPLDILAVTGVFAIFWAAWGGVVAPAIDDVRDDRAVVAALRPHIDAGRELWAVGHAGHKESGWGWFYYNFSRRVKVDNEAVVKLAAAAQVRPVIAVWNGRFSDSGGQHPVPKGFHRINDERLGHHGYYLYLGGPKVKGDDQ